MAKVASLESLTIHSFQSGFHNNAYILSCRQTGLSIIVDAPDKPHELIKAGVGANISAIVITHEHWDHIDGLKHLLTNFNVPVYGSPELEKHISQSVSQFNPLRDNARVTVGNLDLLALKTPGHTPGSMCFYVEAEQNFLFAGDTLFPGGPGMTRSRNDFTAIIDSITSKLLKLPDDTTVLPGHGKSITIGESRREYQHFKSHAKGTEFGQVKWQ